MPTLIATRPLSYARRSLARGARFSASPSDAQVLIAAGVATEYTEGAVSVLNPRGTEETGSDRPAAPSPAAAPKRAAARAPAAAAAPKRTYQRRDLTAERS